MYKMAEDSRSAAVSGRVLRDWRVSCAWLHLSRAANHTRNPSRRTWTPAPYSRSDFMGFLNLAVLGSTGSPDVPRLKILEVPALTWAYLLLSSKEAESARRMLTHTFGNSRT